MLSNIWAFIKALFLGALIIAVGIFCTVVLPVLLTALGILALFVLVVIAIYTEMKKDNNKGE